MRLLARSRMSLFSANEPVLQAIVEVLLPLKYHVPEFWEEEIEKNYISIELKYISLIGLERNINGKQIKELSANELKELDEKLEKENEEILLRRPYVYYAKEVNEWKETTIGEVLNNGIRQLERYMDMVAKGQATKNSVGIYDDRIKVINSSSPNKIMGFIILVIGFHRIIWKSVNEKLTNYKYIVYLMNLFIGLLNMAIEKDNNRVSYLIQKAEILAEIELLYLLPHQRRWYTWFPEVIYYYANIDKTRERVKEIMNESD
ncbi:hypothetical protein GLOIN_2v1774865 [Rhizophagus clarus]|nr:hypothetical protein GLOIN_2v1774865 [Rhizophagus clarus]